jgi:HSP20 family protein
MGNALVTNWMQEVDEMVRAFSPVFAPTTEKKWFSPPVDVEETEKNFFFYFDLPGVSEKELNLTVVGRELNVTGQRNKEIPVEAAETNESHEVRKAHRSERFFGKFERSFILPEEVDSEKIEATFKDGVLEIRVPKVEAAQPKNIPIRTPAEPQ